jgi:TM2 domain-containing membrane protein YozV
MLPNSGKEKAPAGLLAIFLGTLGVHLFYLRQTGWGIVFLLVTLLTCGLGAMITGPISIIQGILYLIANDQDFEQKYVVERRFF